MKDFKGLAPDDPEYKSLCSQVCSHRFVESIKAEQNEQGFWAPFHGYTEAVIRKLLSYGLDKNHECLGKVSDYLVRVINGEDSWNQYEKQDNPLWYPVMFVPLVCSAMLSLVDKNHPAIENTRRQWAYIAKESLADGHYDADRNIAAISECFGVNTKRPIAPLNYYAMLLLAPDGDTSYIDEATDRSLVDYCMTEAGGLCYVYNNMPHDMVNIDACNRDSRDFWHWVRALSIISQFNGWETYEGRYSDWILSQANADGQWVFPKKFDFTLSDSWRGKNKIIDSSIFVMKMLSRKKAF